MQLFSTRAICIFVKCPVSFKVVLTKIIRCTTFFQLLKHKRVRCFLEILNCFYLYYAIKIKKFLTFFFHVWDFSISNNYKKKQMNKLYYSTTVVFFIFLLKMNGQPLFLHCILCSNNNIANKISSRINSFYVLYYKLAEPLCVFPLPGGRLRSFFRVSKF